MEIVQVNLRKEIDDSYNIIIGANLIPIVALDLKKNWPATKYCIVTDSVVKNRFGNDLLKEFKKHGFNAAMVSFPAGEKSKNLKTFSELHEKLALLNLDRKSMIVALGGGVVGDVAGFLASTYMRGISFIQVPTTLLSMVDSSIGGKTGVNLKSGKNLVGTFSQPKRVFIDVCFLKSLPKKEIKNGLAEISKTGVIANRELFEFLEKNIERVLKLDEAALSQVISMCCKTKAKIVELDENERNLRKVLNYGHTIGHAVESLTGYKKFSHGEAVAVGMAVEGKIAVALHVLEKNDLKRQNGLLRDIGLALKMPKFNANRVWIEMQKDKKACCGEIKMVFPEKIGLMKKINGEYAITVPKKTVFEALK